MLKAHNLAMTLIVFGPPGFFWHLPSVIQAVTHLDLTVTRMRLCALGIKFDMADARPSGTYLQVATNLSAVISTNAWGDVFPPTAAGARLC